MKLWVIMAVFMGGCSAHQYNLLEITEDQWIENVEGERCIVKQMLINPETITYFYSNCPVRKVIKPKKRPTPRPKMTQLN